MEVLNKVNQIIEQGEVKGEWYTVVPEVHLMG